jgi:hypothetical protein
MANEKLIAKLVKIMSELDRVPKRGHNAHFNYDYVMETDLADAIRGKLAENGIMMIPNVTKTEWMVTEKGSKICSMSVQFTLTDGNETISYNIEGCGVDNPGDKAPYKALTGAEKYAIMKLFLIPTGDDPELETSSADREGSGERPGAMDGGASRGPQVTPASSGGRELIVAFGKNKGKKISELSDIDLIWWTERCQESVNKNDPEWHKQNVSKLDACKAELARREPWRSVWNKALELAVKSGIGEAALIDVIKEATGKRSAKELVAADYPKIAEAFDKAERDIRESQ